MNNRAGYAILFRAGVAMSKYNETSKEYTKKYIREKLDEIKIRVPKGDKAKYRLHAEQQGESLTAFILRAIREAMQRDSDNP